MGTSPYGAQAVSERLQMSEKEDWQSAAGLLLVLPEPLQEKVLGLLSANGRRSLRATNGQHRRLVDTFCAARASWHRTTPRSTPCLLPAHIKSAKVLGLGCVSGAWLHQSLQSAPYLEELVVQGIKPLQVPWPAVKSRARARLEACALTLIKRMATSPGPGGSRLRKLAIQSVGDSLVDVSDADTRAVLIPPREALVQVLGGLQELTLPEGLHIMRSTLLGLVQPLQGLQRLDLSRTSFSHLLPYATLELSQLVHLHTLVLDECFSVLPSHLTPLCTLRSLRQLDLAHIEVVEADVGPQDHLYLRDNPRPEVVAKAEAVRQALGVPLDLDLHDTDLIYRQLGRCQSLTSLNLRSAALPPERHEAAAVHGPTLANLLLKPLSSRLVSLDLTQVCGGAAEMQQVCGMPHLTRLEMDMGEDDEAEPMGYRWPCWRAEQAIPGLQALSMRLSNLDAQHLPGLSGMTQLTELDLSDPEDARVECMDPMLALLAPCGPNMRKLLLRHWTLSSLSAVASTFTHLQSLCIDNMKDLDTQPFLTVAACRQLDQLEELSCRSTPLESASLCNVLWHCTRLRRLHARGCRLSDVGVQVMVCQLQQCGRAQWGAQLVDLELGGQPDDGPVDALALPMFGFLPSDTAGHWPTPPASGPTHFVAVSAQNMRHGRAARQSTDSHGADAAAGPALAVPAGQPVPAARTSLVYQQQGGAACAAPSQSAHPEVELCHNKLTSYGLTVLASCLPGLLRLAAPGLRLEREHWCALGHSLGALTYLDLGHAPLPGSCVRQLVAGQQPEGTARVFPDLEILVVSDSRMMQGQACEPEDVSALAAGVASGSCNLRELCITSSGGIVSDNFDSGDVSQGSWDDDSSAAEEQLSGGLQLHDDGSQSPAAAPMSGMAAVPDGMGGPGPAPGQVTGGSTSDAGSGEWEEMDVEDAMQADDCVQQQVAKSSQPSLLSTALIEKWLQQGLLVRSAFGMYEAQELHRWRRWDRLD